MNEIAQLIKEINIPGKAYDKFESLLISVFGEGAKEVSGIIGDHVRYWRFTNQVNTLVKARKHLEVKGINPKQVDLKVLVPLLEYISLESHESLQQKWAHLLTNAIGTETGRQQMYTVFVDILRVLSTVEVLILDSIYEYQTERGSIKRLRPLKYKEFNLVEKLNLPPEDIKIFLNNLHRLGLIKSTQFIGGGVGSKLQTSVVDSSEYSPTRMMFVKLTSLGASFVEVCAK